MVSLTESGSTPARRRASLTEITPRSAALRVEREPPNFPIGVRTADAMNTASIRTQYNSGVENDQLKILLSLKPCWTVSLNGLEFQTIRSSDITWHNNDVRFGNWERRIDSVEWLRPNVVRLRGHVRFRTKPDILTLYPGDRLPSGVDSRRRRRTF